MSRDPPAVLAACAGAETAPGARTGGPGENRPALETGSSVLHRLTEAGDRAQAAPSLLQNCRDRSPSAAGYGAILPKNLRPPECGTERPAPVAATAPALHSHQFQPMQGNSFEPSYLQLYRKGSPAARFPKE